LVNIAITGWVKLRSDGEISNTTFLIPVAVVVLGLLAAMFAAGRGQEAVNVR
jgi:hypothetical protein